MSSYRKPVLTAERKAAAHNLYAEIAQDPLEIGIADVKLRQARDHSEYHAMMAPEVQEQITRDSLQALLDASGVAKAQALASAAVRARPAPTVVEAYVPREEQRAIDATPEWVRAGNATFTVVSNATGARFTFRVRQPKADAPHFVGVLTGPDNESSYTYLGTLFADGTYRHGRKSSISADAPSAKAATWFFNSLGNAAAMAKCTVYHEGRCCRCGRKLTVPSSVESGIGPECAGRLA